MKNSEKFQPKRYFSETHKIIKPSLKSILEYEYQDFDIEKFIKTTMIRKLMQGGSYELYLGSIFVKKENGKFLLLKNPNKTISLLLKYYFLNYLSNEYQLVKGKSDNYFYNKKTIEDLKILKNTSKEDLEKIPLATVSSFGFSFDFDKILELLKIRNKAIDSFLLYWTTQIIIREHLYPGSYFSEKINERTSTVMKQLKENSRLY